MVCSAIGFECSFECRVDKVARASASVCLAVSGRRFLSDCHGRCCHHADFFRYDRPKAADAQDDFGVCLRIRVPGAGLDVDAAWHIEDQRNTHLVFILCCLEHCYLLGFVLALRCEGPDKVGVVRPPGRLQYADDVSHSGPLLLCVCGNNFLGTVQPRLARCGEGDRVCVCDAGCRCSSDKSKNPASIVTADRKHATYGYEWHHWICAVHLRFVRIGVVTNAMYRWFQNLWYAWR
jgi:hypothetical protein